MVNSNTWNHLSLFFIIKGFRTIVFIFIVISTTFRPICPRAFFFTKRCGNNNKDEDNSPKNLNDKNQQASSQRFRQQTPEEARRTYRPKRCGNNNKDEDNSPKTLNDKNQQTSSQKFRQFKSVQTNDLHWMEELALDSNTLNHLIVCLCYILTSDSAKLSK